jgi:predicted acyl esterase
MLTKEWSTSAARYDVVIERQVKIRLKDGTALDCEIHRPDSDAKFPAILSASPYAMWMQAAQVRPNSFSSVAMPHPGEEQANSPMEAGDLSFFARRGYVQVVVNVRGSGQSEGLYDFLGTREVEDIVEAIEWVAEQEWCDGKVGMFGVSYFATIQHLVGAVAPPALKCLFAPFGSGGFREILFHGGVFSSRFALGWSATHDNLRAESVSLREWGSEEFDLRIEKALADPDLAAIPEIVAALNDPYTGRNSLIADIVLHQEDGPYWQERTPKYEDISVPIYIGACWASYGIHLPGVFKAWEGITAPKRMVLGPPLYLDRPVFQFQFEALRWFDRWLKDAETGIDDDAAVRLFMRGSGDWIESEEWPLAKTRWTPFNLHEGGLLSERDPWWNEGHDTFTDSPWNRGFLEYWTPPLVDNVEICGPVGLDFFASTSDPGVQWIVSLWEEDPAGNRKILSKGALEGSYAKSIVADSPPYAPRHDFTVRHQVLEDEIVRYQIAIVPTANKFVAGTRLGLHIACADEPNPQNPLQSAGSAHIRSQRARRLAIYHDLERQSCVWIPVTGGNVLGTYMSGGAGYLDFSQ